MAATSLNPQRRQPADALELGAVRRRQWALTNDFSLTTGIRMDQDENFGSHWTPRMYGVWHLTEQWTLKGGVSAGYKSPDLRQSSANWGQVTGGGVRKGIIVGNPDLQPEKSLSEDRPDVG